ncbi:hypothetical protein OVA24_10700 [Luteolibacter sp. SL250]|uniref:hypothetical protein n=1 Tax=Luteolibacter sp. SL250 TaxID=2995170 RepID=UPI00226DF9F2|nr:hypothetical protein [Luteolibacter sp. SL250]WAC21852.1 hypothetical protein OVA24_10700 [Luteolibacter sp. SL250]
MKSFDPMNGGGDNDIEKQLLEMELRPLPAHWKAMILPAPVAVPWLPQPFLAGLCACWAATLTFILLAPPVERMEGPVLRPASELPPPSPEDLLGYNTNP